MTQSFEYGKSVMKRFLKPKFAGELKNANGIGQVGNAACGDIMRVFIKVDKDKKGQEKIKDIRFKTMGCVAAISSSDVVCKLAKGKTLKKALKINKKDITNLKNKVGEMTELESAICRRKEEEGELWPLWS